MSQNFKLSIIHVTFVGPSTHLLNVDHKTASLMTSAEELENRVRYQQNLAKNLPTTWKNYKKSRMRKAWLWRLAMTLTLHFIFNH